MDWGAGSAIRLSNNGRFRLYLASHLCIENGDSDFNDSRYFNSVYFSQCVEMSLVILRIDSDTLGP